MQLAQMESTDITAAVHQDFTGHSVKRLKACLVHQVCRDVYRILMTCSESASFLLQSEVSWRWAWPFNILESFRLDINYRLYCSCASGFHGTQCEKIEACRVQQLCRDVKDISYDLHENHLYGSLEFSNRLWWFFCNICAFGNQTKQSYYKQLHVIQQIMHLLDMWLKCNV